jgi:hypothetical protein
MVNAVTSCRHSHSYLCHILIASSLWFSCVFGGLPSALISLFFSVHNLRQFCFSVFCQKCCEATSVHPPIILHESLHFLSLFVMTRGLPTATLSLLCCVNHLVIALLMSPNLLKTCKTIPEIHFIYLTNKKMYWTLRRAYIISVLFSTKCHLFHNFYHFQFQ